MGNDKMTYCPSHTKNGEHGEEHKCEFCRFNPLRSESCAVCGDPATIKNIHTAEILCSECNSILNGSYRFALNGSLQMA